MSDGALTRTSRALDLIPFVIENAGISIQELANEFKTTPTEITKDLNLLFVCGLPGYTPLELIDLAFDDGYVSVIDPQVLDRPRKLSRREIISLILSLDGLATLRTENDPLKEEIVHLRAKLSEAVAGADQLLATYDSTGETSPFLPLIEAAITSLGQLSIQYISGRSDEVTERRIAPRHLYLEHGNIYLHAFCFLSESERTFRLDRIRECKKIEAMENLPLSEPGKARSGERAEEPILEINRTAQSFLEENAHLLTIQLAAAGTTLAKMAVTDPKWLIRATLAFGSGIRILSPEVLRLALISRASQTLALYR